MHSFVHLIFVYATFCGLVGSGIEAETLPSATAALSEQQEFATSTPTAAATANLGAPAVLGGGDAAVAAIATSTLGSNIDFDSLEFSAVSPRTDVDVAPCSLSSSELNECIRNLFLTIAPKLKNTGLSQYNMISVDPYFYKRGIFRYANDGIQGGLLIKNMNIYGISDLKVNSVLSNFTENDFLIKLGVELPQLRADGQFKADVKFGGLRLVPKGPFNLTVDNIKATVLTDGTIERTESGGQRVRLNRLNANVNIGGAKIVANGIFSDRNLNAMILNLVNENLPEITRVGIPATREQWAPILVAHINEFFAQVPIEKFLAQ